MAEYYYLAASLPMLKKDEMPPVSPEYFMSLCADWLSEKELAIISSLSLIPSEKNEFPPESVAFKWIAHETALRNRMLKTRAAASGVEAEKYLREESSFFTETEKNSQDLAAAANPFEKEKLADSLRWNFLSELESGHFFDFDKLCVYKLQLLILEKWQTRNVDKGNKELDRLLGCIKKDSDERKNNI